MKPGAKDLIRTCGIALVLMLVFPAVFRIWMEFNPPPPHEPLPELASFDVAVVRESRAKLLLRKPLPDWTENDRKSEPVLAGWLAEHAKVVLPWEWSDAARVKDPDGYRNIWRNLLDGERKRLEKTCRIIERTARSSQDSADIARALHSHSTNELARLAAVCATNTYPASVERYILAKGRFWGWNRDVEQVALPDTAAAAALMDKIRQDAELHVADIRRAETAKKALDEDEKRLKALIGELEGAGQAFFGDDAAKTIPKSVQDRAFSILIAAIWKVQGEVGRSR